MNRRNRIILYCLYIVILASACLIVLNHAAPNPTGRWFSSQFVDINQTGQVFGTEAEIILAHDLGIPRNDSPDGSRICFCSQNDETPPGRCNVCEVNTGYISNWHIPDFVTSALIIDSKAVSNFTLNEQISSFIQVAQQTNRPLWIYVRQDSTYSQSTRAAIRATGGDIIEYYVVDGYAYLLVIEQSINNIIIIALIVAGAVMIWQFISLRQGDTPPEDEYRYDDIDRAEESLEETEEYMRRMERLSKRSIKNEDEDQKK